MDELQDPEKNLTAPKKNLQSRKYAIAINNPLDALIEIPKGSGTKVNCPFTHEEIKARMKNLTSVVYWCMADEIGLEGKTPHTHLYLVARSPIRFSTVKNLFPTAHIEAAYGDSKTNRDYVKKEGRWAKSKKKETSIEGTFEEFGEIPANEKIGLRGELQFIYDMIESGLSTADILKTFPEALRYLDKIDRARQLLIENEYQNTWRDLTVTYISGETRLGKTRGIMEQYGYSNVFRVTNYKNPFDNYKNQKVIIFEEFRSSLKIQDMLIYLDGYPCVLPARYNDKQACYLNVYLDTNIPLEEQYTNVQTESPRTWNAFLRRINTVVIYNTDGTITTYDSVESYLQRNEHFHKLTELEQINLPFKD